MCNNKQIKICECGQVSNMPRIASGEFNPLNGVLTLTRTDGSTVTALIPLTGTGGLGGGHVIVDGIDQEQPQHGRLKFGPTFLVSDEPLDNQTHVEDVLYVTQLPDSLAMPYSVGGLNAGTTVLDLKGLPMSEIVSRLLFPATPVVYTPPTLSLIGSHANNLQMTGDLFSPRLTFTFTQNDAGTLTLTELWKVVTGSGPNVISTTSPYTDIGIESITPATFQYYARAHYDQGPILSDNYGIPNPTGRIPSGYVTSNSVVYKTVYPWYWGVSNTSTVTPTDIINGTRIVQDLPSNGTSISFNPTATLQYIWVALPMHVANLTDWSFTVLNEDEMEPGSLFEGLTDIETVTDTGTGSGFTTNYKLYVTSFATTNTDPTLTLTNY